MARARLSTLARRQAQAQEAFASTMSSGTTEGRVGRLLLREAREGSVRCSQATLAGMLGRHRPTLNRVLKDFERAGLLRVGYREVVVLSADRLRHQSRTDNR